MPWTYHDATSWHYHNIASTCDLAALATDQKQYWYIATVCLHAFTTVDHFTLGLSKVGLQVSKMQQKHISEQRHRNRLTLY